MLAIRMQRTGRKGHAMFRVVVQDSRRTPTSGKVVAFLGAYDPHAKTSTLAKDKAEFYLSHGAQPSERVVTLLEREGVKLPAWITKPAERQGKTRNPDKKKQSGGQAETAAETSEQPAETAPEAGAAESTETQEAEKPATEAKTNDAESNEPPAETTEKTATTTEPTATDETNSSATEA